MVRSLTGRNRTENRESDAWRQTRNNSGSTRREVGYKWKKNFTTMAPVLDYFIISASMEGQEEVGEFVIPRNTLGVSIEETWDSVAMRGTASHDLVLQNVEIESRFLQI